MPFPSTADIRERVGCSIGRKPESIARHRRKAGSIFVSTIVSSAFALCVVLPLEAPAVAAPPSCAAGDFESLRPLIQDHAQLTPAR